MSHNPTGDLVPTSRWPLVWCCLLVALWCGPFSALGLADTKSPRIESIQVGFRHVVEAGRWNPIRVSVSGESAAPVTVRIVAADVEGRSVRHASPPITLSATPQDVSLVYQHGPLKSPVIVELVADGQVRASQLLRHTPEDSALTTVRQNTDLVLCLGERQIGFEEAARLASEPAARKLGQVDPLIVQHYTPEQLGELPRDVRAWDSVDVVAISPQCSIPEDLGSVLNQWVRRGGRLILTGGPEVSAAASPGLSQWVPVRVDGQLNQRDLSSLKTLVTGGSTLRLVKGSIPTVRWATDNRLALAQSLDGPIVVRAPHGQGTVTAIALDLNARPFVSVDGELISIEWESLVELWRWLGGLPNLPRIQSDQQRPQTDLNPTGVSDLQTQLVNALDQFPDLVRPSYWVVLGSALLFLVVVGPLDWLLVHRLLKRPHLTWVTLPVWIGLGALIGMTMAARIGGSEQLVRQVDLLTWDAAAGETQMDSWLALTSPTHQRYTLKCTGALTETTHGVAADFRWASRPEAGFRGIYRESEQIGAGASLDISADLKSLDTLPISHGDSAIIEAKAVLPESLPVVFDLSDNSDRHLMGTMTHSLSGELVDWIIGYGSFAYVPSRDEQGFIRPWSPGQTIQLEKVQSRLIADHLGKVVSRSVVRRDGKSRDFSFSRTEYDPLDNNVYDLLKTISFNQLGGGKTYTGLDNSTLRPEDLSPLVNSRCAVLFARLRNASYPDAPLPGISATEPPAGQTGLFARYSQNGQTLSPKYRDCFIRMILPVKSSSPSETPPP